MEKNVFLALTGVVVIFCALTVTASSPLSTPLYTYRMEQVSSAMGFLPADITTFTYITETGCSLPYDAVNQCHTQLLATVPDPSCMEPTCYITCGYTCFGTCAITCPETCQITCRYTCKPPC